MGKESDESLKSLALFNNEISQLSTEGINIMYNNIAYTIKVDIISYMLDMKAAHLYLGSGYCDLCTLSKEQCFDRDRIEGGFVINRNVETLHAIFDELCQDDGSIAKHRYDYEERGGQTHKPIATNEEKIKNNTGIKWDFPDATGKGGITTTGNVARTILHSPVNRNLVIDDIPLQFKVNDGNGLGMLDETGLEGNNKILRNIRTKLSRTNDPGANIVDTIRRMWVSSDPKINVERFRAKSYCKHCNVTGHSTRYCKEFNIFNGAMNEDDSYSKFGDDFGARHVPSENFVNLLQKCDDIFVRDLTKMIHMDHICMRFENFVFSKIDVKWFSDSAGPCINILKNIEIIAAPVRAAMEVVESHKNPSFHANYEPPKFPVDFNSDPVRGWKNFSREWNSYRVCSRLDKQPNEIQFHAFLTAVGKEGRQLYEGFRYTAEECKTDLATVINKFETFSLGTQTELAIHAQFYSRMQREEESTSSFISDVFRLTDSCRFTADKDVIDYITRFPTDPANWLQQLYTYEVDDAAGTAGCSEEEDHSRRRNYSLALCIFVIEIVLVDIEAGVDPVSGSRPGPDPGLRYLGSVPVPPVLESSPVPGSRDPGPRLGRNPGPGRRLGRSPTPGRRLGRSPTPRLGRNPGSCRLQRPGPRLGTNPGLQDPRMAAPGRGPRINPGPGQSPGRGRGLSPGPGLQHPRKEAPGAIQQSKCGSTEAAIVGYMGAYLRSAPDRRGGLGRSSMVDRVSSCQEAFAKEQLILSYSQNGFKSHFSYLLESTDELIIELSFRSELSQPIFGSFIPIYGDIEEKKIQPASDK
ncbi:hypothetical protein GQR58_021057 [Nymphon striatum]|nr:hypothetical protein GQR58_021057 [Nymphon striatum]